MTPDALFGDLRSILQRPASSETWGALCDHLDLWSNDALEAVALPYSLDIITRWPGELERTAPKRWVERLLAGEDVASLVVVNTLSLESSQLSQPQLTAVLTSQRLTSLRTLDLHDNNIFEEGAKALADAPLLKDLTCLKLGKNDIGDEGVRRSPALQTSKVSPHLT